MSPDPILLYHDAALASESPVRVGPVPADWHTVANPSFSSVPVPVLLEFKFFELAVTACGSSDLQVQLEVQVRLSL